MLADLEISSWLYAGFGTIMVLILLITGIATMLAGSIWQDLKTIKESNSIKQRYVINFRGSVQDRAIALRDVILADESQLPEIRRHIHELSAKYNNRPVRSTRC